MRQWILFYYCLIQSTFISSRHEIYKYRNRFKGFCDRDAIYCQNKKWLFPLFLFEILSKGRMWWRRCLLLPFGCQESKVSYNFRADISIPSMYIVHHLFYICPRSSKRKKKPPRILAISIWNTSIVSAREKSIFDFGLPTATSPTHIVYWMIGRPF